MRDPNYYQMKISEYDKRRTQVREEILSLVEQKRERLKRLTIKINTWRRSLKNVQVKKSQIISLGEDVSEFMGVNIRNSSSTDRKIVLARYIFYKYGLENGIKGDVLRSYTGATGSTTAARARRNFNRSFITNRENKELYEAFKLFIDDKDIG